MVYPDTPFTNKFDSTSLFHLNKTGGSVGKEPDLDKVLRWLCTTPKITSYRVNTNVYTLNQVKDMLEDPLRQCCLDSNEDISSQIVPHITLPDVLLVKGWNLNLKELNKHEKEIIVDPMCGAAVLRGSHIFAPGVLAMQSGTRSGDLVSIYVDISRKCKKGLRIAYDCPQKLFIGNGSVLMARHELFGDNIVPSGVAVKMSETISRVPCLDTTELPEDSVLLQNIPSVVCGHVLSPEPGETILDMCASPGNKTSHLAQLMKNQGIIIALDKTPNKISQLRDTIKKFRYSCVHPFAFDSTKSCDLNMVKMNREDMLKGPPFSRETFDRILLDAPCSNLGRRPQLYNGISEKEARSYVPLQRKLFTNAVHLLKFGGHLVFSTCTITLSENEGMVAWALENFPELLLVPAEPVLGGPGLPLTKLTTEQNNMLQRFGPEQTEDAVGFFIAHFVKK